MLSPLLITRDSSLITLLSQELDHPRIVDERQTMSRERAEQLVRKVHRKRECLAIPEREEELLEEKAIQRQVTVRDQRIARAVLEEEDLSKRYRLGRDRRASPRPRCAGEPELSLVLG